MLRSLKGRASTAGGARPLAFPITADPAQYKGVWAYFADDTMRYSNGEEWSRGDAIVRLDEPLIKTVGPGGDFATLGGALVFFSAYLSGARDKNILGTVKILSGVTLTEQVVIFGVDLGWVQIISEDSIVDVDAAEFNVEYNVEYYPFLFFKFCKAPVINTKFRQINTLTHDGSAVGLLLRQSTYVGYGNNYSGVPAPSFALKAGLTGFDVNADVNQDSSAVFIDFELRDGSVANLRTNSYVRLWRCRQRGSAGGISGSGANIDVASSDLNLTVGVNSNSDLVLDRGVIARISTDSLCGTAQASVVPSENGLLFDERSVAPLQWKGVLTPEPYSAGDLPAAASYPGSLVTQTSDNLPRVSASGAWQRLVAGDYYWTPFMLGSGLRAWFDLQDPATMTIARDGTGAAPGNGDPVGQITDISGRGVTWTAPADAQRPILRSDDNGWRLDWDNVDDTLSWTLTATGQTGIATRSGSYVAGTDYSGAFAMPVHQPFDYTDVVIADFLPPDAFGEWAKGRGAVKGFGAVTDFDSAFRGRTDLTSFPLIDTSAGTGFSNAWNGCTGLTSFPLIDTSLATTLGSAWFGCTGLTSFPLIDTSSATGFASAFRSCTGLTSFPLINTGAATNLSLCWDGCTGLTSFPLIDTSSATDLAFVWRGCSSLTAFPALDFGAATNLTSAWANCSSLTTFPAGVFDTTPCTAFNFAFANTALTQTSIDNVLVSINAAATSSGTFVQSGGSAPSATGEAAVTALRGRGWTVTVTGGF